MILESVERREPSQVHDEFHQIFEQVSYFITYVLFLTVIKNQVESSKLVYLGSKEISIGRIYIPRIKRVLING